MAITWSGAISNGPDSDASRYFDCPMPSTPTGDFAIFLLVKLASIYAGADFTSPSTNSIGLAQNFLTGAGTSGNDCYIRLRPKNATSNAGKLEVSLRSGSTFWNSLAALFTGSTSWSLNDTVLLVMQSNGGTVQVKSCLKGAAAGAVVTEASDTRNASFGAKALGTWRIGLGSTATVVSGSPQTWQALGMVNRALTDAEISSLAAGTDPESVVTVSGDRLALWQFKSTASSIASSWGAASAATRNGTWTNQPVASPPFPNDTGRIEVTNEPVNYGAVAINDDGTNPTHTITGSYQGTAPTAVQARVENPDGSDVIAWTDLANFTASGGTWSGDLANIPHGGLYRLQVRDKNLTSRIWRGGNAWSCCAVLGSMGQSPYALFTGTYKGVETLTGNFYVRHPSIPQIQKAASACVGAGLAKAMTAYNALTSKPFLMTLTAVVGTSSTQWAAKDASIWPDFLAAMDAIGRPKRILLSWLNGAADSNTAAIKGNHDTIVSNLDADLTVTRGMAYRYKILPHNRDTGNTSINGAVRKNQYEWARDHAQSGTKVLLGPWWPDMQTNTEAAGATAQAGGATSITLAANDDAQGNTDRVGNTIAITGGTGAGQSKTISGYVVTTKVATVSAWTTQPDATSVYRISATSPHPAYAGPPANQGVTRFSERWAQSMAFNFGLTAKGGRGPVASSATYPNGGNGQVLDVKFTHRHGTALQTPNGSTGATVLAGWEVSTDGGTTYAAPSSAVIKDATTVRLTLASAPGNKANLRIRYGWQQPISEANFDGAGGGPNLSDLLYDNAAIGPTAGLPAYFTTADLTPTEAPAAVAGGGVLLAAL